MFEFLMGTDGAKRAVAIISREDNAGLVRWCFLVVSGAPFWAGGTNPQRNSFSWARGSEDGTALCFRELDFEIKEQCLLNTGRFCLCVYLTLVRVALWSGTSMCGREPELALNACHRISPILRVWSCTKGNRCSVCFGHLSVSVRFVMFCVNII